MARTYLQGIELKKVGAVSAITVMAAIALTACAAATPAVTKAPEVKPTPVETGTPFSVDSLLIPTTLTPQQVGVKFEADWDALENASTTDAFDTQVVLHKTTVADQAPKDVAVFAEAVTSSGSKSTSVTNWLSGMTKGHTDTLTDWFATYESSNAADHHPFRNWTTVDSVTPVGTPSASSLELKIDITDHNNGSDNTVGANSTDGLHEVNDVTFVNENGNRKVSDIH